MITNVSLVTVFCLDQDEARDFYVNMLGFEAHTDVMMGEETGGSACASRASPNFRSR